MGKSIFLLVFDLRIANFSSTSRQRLVEVPALGAWRISVSPWGVELELKRGLEGKLWREVLL